MTAWDLAWYRGSRESSSRWESRLPRRCAAVGWHGKLGGGLGFPEVSQADARDLKGWLQHNPLEPQLGAINPDSRDADARRVRQVTRSAFR